MAATHARPRVLLPLLLALSVLLVAAVGGTGWYKQTQIQREVARDITVADAAWNAALADAVDLNTAAIPFICEDKRLSDAMMAKNRGRLLATALPTFDRLKQESGVTDLIFRDPNLVAVLRPREPETFGDRSTSALPRRAMTAGKPASGLELTRGVLTVRTIQPWKKDGQLLGYIELAQQVDPLVRRLGQTLGNDVILLIDKGQTHREEWEKTAVAAGRLLKWDMLPNEVIASQTTTTLPKELIAAISLRANVGNLANGNQSEVAYQVDGRHFHGGWTQVRDAAGTPFGRLIILKDMTELYTNSQSTTLWIAGVSILGAGAVGLFFMLIIRRLHRGLSGAQQRLTFDIRHDPLTTLNNRANFIEHLDGVLRQATETKDRQFALLYLDFDRFKVINDSLGHEIGDLLLQGIAGRLRFSLAQAGTAGLSTVGRLGSDEFVVLLDPLADLKEAPRLADQLLCSLCKPFMLKEHEIISTVSIGIATSDGNYTRAVDMIRDADVAMFHAKNSGRGRVVAFDQTMREKVLARIELEHDLAYAVGRNELRLYYQPLISFDDGKLVGFEALVRWQHPKRGFVSPMDFIPIAEESGLILQIGNWVLEEGCRQLHNWRQGYPELELTMSINLSRKQLAYPDLLERVERLLVANAIPASALKLEITESTVMENGTASIGVLQAIRAMGVHLWMDDFGTGYSSLSCLHRFPLNGIKIDRAFIRNVSERRDYAAVVHAIVSLASNLGMHVVAEGVETEDQVALLKSLECHLGQGYLFSKPMDAKTAETYIQKYTPLSRAA